jgi:hypothetical protein
LGGSEAVAITFGPARFGPQLARKVISDRRGQARRRRFARLLGLPVTGLRERFYERGPKSVALACRAAGIDRCVFSTIFTLSRKAHGMVQPLRSNDMADIDAAFLTPKPAALDLLQAA